MPRRRRAGRRKARPADDYSREILRELEQAGEPLRPDELAERLRIRPRERRAFNAGLAALERAAEGVQNRAGALLVAKRIALVAGRVEGPPAAPACLIPAHGRPHLSLTP